MRFEQDWRAGRVARLPPKQSCCRPRQVAVLRGKLGPAAMAQAVEKHKTSPAEQQTGQPKPRELSTMRVVLAAAAVAARVRIRRPKHRRRWPRISTRWVCIVRSDSIRSIIHGSGSFGRPREVLVAVVGMKQPS